MQSNLKIYPTNITLSLHRTNIVFFQMNGFELAGRAMKVGHVTDRTDGQLGGLGGQGGMQQNL